MSKRPIEQDCRYCRFYRRPLCLKHDEYTKRRSTCKEFRPGARPRKVEQRKEQ